MEYDDQNHPHVEFDLKAEVSALRKQSPLTTRATVAILTTTIATVAGICAVYGAEAKSPTHQWSVYGIIATIAIAGTLFSYMNIMKAKQLIESGVVVKAELQSAIKLVQSIYRVAVRYKLNDKQYDKILYVSAQSCGGIEGAGYVLLAVSPKKPLMVEPLYSFAKQEQFWDIITGQRGLADP